MRKYHATYLHKNEMTDEKFMNKKIITIANDKSMLRINCTDFNFAL